MRDVAERAGVGIKTVSRVVNGEPNVSPQMAARVNAAVLELGYRHNLLASNLRRGLGTDTIGVLVQDIANSFSATLLRAVEQEAMRYGIAVFTASIDEETEREVQLVASLVARRIDGLILIPTTPEQDYLAHAVQEGLQVVAVDRPATGLDVDTVLVDNRRGSRTAVQHLARHGHRRIGCLSDFQSIWTARERHVGFLEGMTQAGLEVDPSLVFSDAHDQAAGVSSLRRMLDRSDPPTALFTARNELTIAAVRVLRELGLSEQVALVGFDDFPLADLLTPGVTVVRQDARAVGREAAALLVDRLHGQGGDARTVLLPTTLVARGTGEIAPPV